MKNNFKELLIISLGGKEESSTFPGGTMERVIWKMPMWGSKGISLSLWSLSFPSFLILLLQKIN